MSCCCGSAPEKSPAPRESDAKALLWLKLAIAALLSGLTMYLSLGANLGDPQGAARLIIHSLLAMVCLGAIVGLTEGLFPDAWRDLRRRKITLEHAFIIGIVGSFAASLYSSITEEGAIYYEVVVVLIAIYLFGQTIKSRQVKKQRELAETIPGLLGQATILEGDKRRSVAVGTIQAGQHLIVRAGEMAPVDCRITEGSAYIEQQPHTGETYPQSRKAGDSLLAGSTVLDGDITVVAESSGNDREVDRIFSSLESLDASPTESEALAQKILSYFVPVVLAIAVLTGIVWTLLGYSREAWLHALTVTVVACPCALGIAIPLATRRGLSELKRLGIIPDEASYLDRLAQIDHIAFDKTGTLSNPSLELSSFDMAADAPAELKNWVLEIQKRSSHPVARPFWKLYSKGSKPLRDLSVEILPGRGIHAAFRDDSAEEELLIGNAHMLADQGLERPDSDAGRTIYILYKGKIEATAHLNESSRKRSAETLESLTQDEYRVSILTGDSSAPADYDIPKVEIHSGLSSEEKAAYLREVAAANHTLYIGDGLNDCEGFQNAHASLALKSGNQTAQTVAQATLLHDDLSIVPQALLKVKSLKRRLNKILLFSFSYNAVGISLAALGLIHPVIAAILMFASSIFVISFMSGSYSENNTQYQV